MSWSGTLIKIPRASNLIIKSNSTVSTLSLYTLIVISI